MTSTNIKLVNQDIDDYFTETYGKNNFLSMFDLNESNWGKMVKGERRMPKYFKIIMKREQEILKLEKAFKATSPNVSTEKLIKHLESNERSEIGKLRFKLDKYESALRTIENVSKMFDKALIKAEQAR